MRKIIVILSFISLSVNSQVPFMIMQKLSNGFVALNQTNRSWRGLGVLGNNVYACVGGGDIYMQTNGTGDFAALSQTSRNWRAFTSLGSDIYCCVLNGDIYKQTGGTGDFTALSQTSRAWSGMATYGGNVYACVYNGDIYMQTGGAGNFVALSQTTRLWAYICASSTGVYATNSDGDIFKQTSGTGDFNALSTGLTAIGITYNGSDLYVACSSNVYVQYGESGAFNSISTLNFYGLCSLGSSVYGSVLGGDIYKKQ